MYTLAGKNLDFTALMRSRTATGRELVNEVMAETPEFVKSASLVEGDDSVSLQDNQFALILYRQERDEHGQMKTANHRLFPIHNKAYTWLQMQALAKTADQLPEEARKVASFHIKNAALRHGLDLPDRIAQDGEDHKGFSNRVDMTTLDDPTHKVASAEEQEGYDDPANWGLMREGEAKRYPLHTPTLVKQAMEYVEQHELAFVPRDRYDLCCKIVDKAAELDMPVTEKVASYGGRSYSEAVDHMIRLRELHVQGDEEKEALQKVASAKETIDPREFAIVLNEFDQATKMAERAKGMPSAFDGTLGEMGPLEGYTDRQLSGAVATHQKKLSSYLGRGWVRQFVDNPRETYAGLEDQQRDVFHQILSGGL